MVVSLLFGHLVPLDRGGIGGVRLGLGDDWVGVTGAVWDAAGHDVSSTRPPSLFFSRSLARIHSTVSCETLFKSITKLNSIWIQNI